ncbi:MAG: hypothetical protein LBR23_01755 [Spirochaetaceae bacterium]|jgi:metal-sulfur cluster biosynthetic enzyme|nr:hypothetical protein [Spirochaetaceae bacterium]
MKAETQKKIDGILCRVVEKGSLMSCADLDLVRKVTVSDSSRLVRIQMDGPGDNRSCICAGLVGDMLRGSVERDLKAEFEREFAGYRVEFADQ